MLPTSSAGYWSPFLLVIATSASDATNSIGGDFLSLSPRQPVPSPRASQIPPPPSQPIRPQRKIRRPCRELPLRGAPWLCTRSPGTPGKPPPKNTPTHPLHPKMRYIPLLGHGNSSSVSAGGGRTFPKSLILFVTSCKLLKKFVLAHLEFYKLLKTIIQVAIYGGRGR